MAVLFFLASMIFFVLALHPFIFYPLSLHLMKKHFLRPIAAGDAPKSYAICVCAYNESSIIREKAQNLMALKKALPGLEVFIYVDCASDDTAKILEEYKDEFDVTVATERHGKTYGMNLLVSKATADVVIFSDANVMLDIGSVTNLDRYFSDPEVGCVCGHLKYVNGASSETAENGSLYWKLEEWVKQMESDTGSIMGADGSIFAIRRDLHVPPPADMIDDMYVSFQILLAGKRIVRAPDVIAYEESVTIAREEFKRKVRIACQAFNIHRALWPRLKELPALDLYKYVSHKLLRWFTIVWLVAGVTAFELMLVSADLGGLAFGLLILGLVALAAGFLIRIPVLSQIVDILYAFLGVGVGVWKSYSGERFQTWAPAASIRQKKG